MDDLISRQEAIDAFKKELTVGESKGNYVTICSAVGYEGAKQILERLPSAELVRMKGRWETDSYGAMDDGEYLMTRCSVCGTAYEYGHDDRYCGFCGAEMSEGEEDG